MKRFLVCISVILVLVIILPVAVFASEDRASNYFMKDSCYIYVTSNTKFQVWFDVTAVGGMDEIGVSKITVQRSTDEVSWTSVETFTRTECPQMIATNTGHHSGYISYTAVKGYYYRAYVEFYAKRGLEAQ